jgi:SHS2 domain-containing protein
MEKRFEYLEHLSDTGIRFYGKNHRQLFENAALGMFSVISNTENVQPLKDIEIDIVSEGNDLEDILILWLEKLLYYHEVDKMLFSEFMVSSLKKQNKKYRLSAVASGEKIDFMRHEIKIGIKAPTYHQLKIEGRGSSWQGNIIFDI